MSEDSISFEVRTYKDGRWLTEYRSDDERSAIAHAKTLFQGRRYKGIKVIRERYNHEAGAYQERVVYNFFKKRDEPMARAKSSTHFYQRKPPPPRKTFWDRLAEIFE